MKLFVATQNKNKIKEIVTLIPDLDIELIVDPHEIPETASSYIGNSLIKARYWHKIYPEYHILADDSGLEVLALDGEPGINSAHWAGEKSSQDNLIKKLLSRLANTDIKNREAKFICYMTLISPENEVFVAYGESLGQIALERSGQNGFGFDPIFLPIEYGYTKSFAEISTSEKNAISHRYKALKIIKEYINFVRNSHV